MLFSAIEDSVVILKSKGVYKQVKAYRRNGFIYAGYGSGFIRIVKNGSVFGTSVSDINVDGFDLGFEPAYGDYGYMIDPK